MSQLAPLAHLKLAMEEVAGYAVLLALAECMENAVEPVVPAALWRRLNFNDTHAGLEIAIVGKDDVEAEPLARDGGMLRTEANAARAEIEEAALEDNAALVLHPLSIDDETVNRFRPEVPSKAEGVPTVSRLNRVRRAQVLVVAIRARPEAFAPKALEPVLEQVRTVHLQAALDWAVFEAAHGDEDGYHYVVHLLDASCQRFHTISKVRLEAEGEAGDEPHSHALILKR